MPVLEFWSIYSTATFMNLTCSSGRRNLGEHSDASYQQNFGKKKSLVTGLVHKHPLHKPTGWISDLSSTWILGFSYRLNFRSCPFCLSFPDEKIRHTCAVGIRGDFNHELGREEALNESIVCLWICGKINKRRLADAGSRWVFMISFHPPGPSLSDGADDRRHAQQKKQEKKLGDTQPSLHLLKKDKKGVFIAGFKLIPKCNKNPVWHFNELFSASWRFSVWSSEAFFVNLKGGKPKI